MNKRISHALLLAILLGGAAVVWAQQPVDIKYINGVAPVSALCDDPSKVVNLEISETAATGNVSLVAPDGSEVIYICGYTLTMGGASVVTWETGTGATCGTGTEIEETLDFNADGDGIAIPNAGHVQMKSDAADRLCINRASSVAISGRVTYVQQ